MHRSQCFLVIIALLINLAHCWDIAITTGDQLEFYTNNTKINSEGTRFRDLTALAYDAVHNMLLFVDKQNDNASIFSFHIGTKKYQSLVRRKSYENIDGLAFDPVKAKLFWTDTYERSIYWMSLKPGSKNDIYGNLLIKMDDEIPRSIAVDSCRGYIYWSNTNISKPTIERARFDGSERSVIINKDIFMPVSIAIDQRSKKLYWADDREGIHYSIESSDLEGNNRKTLLVDTYHQPNAITVSKDSIYWVDWGFKSVWKLPKTADNVDIEPEKMIVFTNEYPFGIVANYGVEEQTNGEPECDEYTNLSKNKSAINDSFSIPKDVGLFCLHGAKVEGKYACKCKPGYVGDRCETSVCNNYCFQGDCSTTAEGHPICRCKNGFSGTRCEVNLCEGHCVNGGVCKLDKDQKPTCKCTELYQGSRCEVTRVVPTEAPQTVKSIIIEESCNCTQERNNTTAFRAAMIEATEAVTDDEFVTTCNDGWDPIRDPILMVLGVLCGLLCLACAVLITKILQLKKRPRIKKRIIVNKNVTPLTARPDQCEITIENCCNMNICETPCFEPRSTIRPSLLDSKPGKEEKKNLISNMEFPDDY